MTMCCLLGLSQISRGCERLAWNNRGMIMNMVKPKNSEKKCSSATSSNKKFISSRLELNSDPSGIKPANSRLNNATALWATTGYRDSAWQSASVSKMQIKLPQNIGLMKMMNRQRSVWDELYKTSDRAQWIQNVAYGSCEGADHVKICSLYRFPR